MSLEFQVPQFIDIEDKIFGSLTIKQFVYVAGGLGAAYLIYYLGGFFVALIIGGPILGFAFALAFYKHNEQPFIKLVENFFNYSTAGKVYIWKQPIPDKKKDEAADKQEQMVETPTINKSRLKDLAWSLDIKEKIK